MSDYPLLCKYRNLIRVAIEEALDQRRTNVMSIFVALGRAAGLHEKANASYWTADYIVENVADEGLRAIMLEQLMAIHDIATQRLSLNSQLNRLCAKKEESQ